MFPWKTLELSSVCCEFVVQCVLFRGNIASCWWICSQSSSFGVGMLLDTLYLCIEPFIVLNSLGSHQKRGGE
jgi:hypothetical protein